MQNFTRSIHAAALLCVAWLIVPAEGLSADWQPTSGPDGGYVRSLAGSGQEMYCLIDNAVHRWEADSWQRGAETKGSELHYWQGNLFTVEMVAGVPQLMISRDQGSSFELADLPDAARNEQIIFYAGEESIYAGIGALLFRSEDARNWGLFAECDLNAGPIVQIAGTAGSLLVVRAFSDEVCRFDAAGNVLSSVNLPQGSGFMANLLVADGAYVLVSSSNGAFRSLDGGVTWEEINQGLEPTPGGAFPRPQLTRYYDGSVWMLDNQGNLWQFQGSRWQSMPVPSQANDFLLSSDRFVLASFNGVQISQDKGLNWQPANTGLFYQNVDVLFNLDGVLIANSNSATVRSLDGGKSWETTFSVPIRAITAKDGVLYARMAPWSTQGALFRSDDLGASWEPLNNDLDSPLMDLSGLAHDGEYLYISFNGYFQLHGRGISRWGFGGVRRSADNGQSWTDVSAGLPHDVNVPVPTPQVLVTEKALLLATAAGVYRSENAGGSWERVFGGLPPEAKNHSLAADGSRVYASFAISTGTALHYDVFMSEDAGLSWRSIRDGLPHTSDSQRFSVSSIDAFDGEVYLHSFFDGEYHLFKYHDEKWQDQTAELPQNLVLRTLLVMDGVRYAAAANGGVWRDRAAVSTLVQDLSLNAGSIEVFPNPTADELYINFDLNSFTIQGLETGEQTLRLTLFNTLGTEVARIDMQNQGAGLYRVELPNALRTGAYMFRVTGAAGVFYGTFVRS